MSDVKRVRGAAALGSIGLFAFTIWQIGATLGESPAWTPALQVEAVTGGNRPLAVTAMYDRAEYLYHIAYGAANSDLLTLSGSADTLAPADERWARAREAAEASLSLAPTNAHAWQVLAAARLYAGDYEGAVDALILSGRYAPYVHEIVDRRLSLGLGTLPLETPNMDELVPILVRDAQTMADYSPRFVQVFRKELAELEERAAALEDRG